MPNSVVKLAKKLKKSLSPFAKRIEIAGSIRRRKPDPRDVDILVIPSKENSKKGIAKFLSRRGAITREGDDVVSAVIKRTPVDVYYTTPESCGAGLQFLTGSAGYSIGLRVRAKKMGMKLNQKGLFDRRTGRYIAGRTERDIFKALGKYRERGYFKAPELRDGRKLKEII